MSAQRKLIRRCFADIQPEPDVVIYADGAYRFATGLRSAYREYAIPRDRVRTSAEALNWVQQVAAKNWCTTWHIVQFIALVERHGVPVGRGA
jgi:hypothetical protein